MQVSNFLAVHGFKKTKLVLSTKGSYTVRDSEWNYSDVPHLTHVHTKVDACHLLISKTDICNLFLQQIGPFSIPAFVHISHVEADKHSYVMSVLNIVITVETVHTGSSYCCDTTTTYEFHYKGMLGWLVSNLAKYATKKNYNTLMSEDVPMRNQRSLLRREGFNYESDKQNIIGFSDTIDITICNINATSSFARNGKLFIDILGPSGEVTIDEYKCFLHWTSRMIWIMPMICPHEGAELSYTPPAELSEKSIPTVKCPWHGKTLKPLAILDRTKPFHIEFNYLHATLVVSNLSTEPSSANTSLLLYAKSPEV